MPDGTKKLITVLTLFWAVYLIPTSIMIILSLRGESVLATVAGPGSRLLYWTVMTYPLVLLVSILGSWVSYHHKKLILAKVFALLPLVSIFLELIAADLLLLL